MTGTRNVTWPELGGILFGVGNAIFWGLLWILDDRYGAQEKDIERLLAGQQRLAVENARRAGADEIQCVFLRNLVQELKPETVPLPCSGSPASKGAPPSPRPGPFDYQSDSLAGF